MSWLRVTRPLQLGGLGVLNLEIMAWALHMRWMWQWKIQPDKPWAMFNISFPEAAHLRDNDCWGQEINALLDGPMD